MNKDRLIGWEFGLGMLFILDIFVLLSNTTILRGPFMLLKRKRSSFYLKT